MLRVDFIREQALRAMNQKFEEMLKENLNNMTQYFDKRISMAIDESMDTKIKPIFEAEVEKQIKQETFATHIQTEVARYARKNVTLATNEALV